LIFGEFRAFFGPNPQKAGEWSEFRHYVVDFRVPAFY